MKTSKQAWEYEYANRRLMTGVKPAKSFLQWIKHVIKEDGRRGSALPLQGTRVLDLGSGEGKNALYLATLGATVDGIEIASNAVATTKERIKELSDVYGSEFGVVRVREGSIGQQYQFPDATFDLIIDITSSNSLSETERMVYLNESCRVLKSGGRMFVRALCKDGDTNAKQLLKLHPGQEHDTYLQPDWGLVERVFSEVDIKALYGTKFTILNLTKETHYTTVGTQKYKRNFWLLSLRKS